MRDLASHMLDVVQNSVRTRATKIEIKDNGERMNCDTQKLLHPNDTTTKLRKHKSLLS